VSATAEAIVLAAFVAFCRVGGCFLLMPGLASVRVPVQIRLFVAIAATGALLVHLWDQILPLIDRRPQILAPMIVSELMIGALIGLMARLYMMALQFIGAGVAMLIGYGGMAGPGIEEAEPLSRRCSCSSFSISTTRSSARSSPPIRSRRSTSFSTRRPPSSTSPTRCRKRSSWC
jgi:flagellar biosynthetic protein FliR